ncbi:chlorophyll synthesis pathway protein BchC [Rhodobacteraceae bacterium 2376]|uniref:Chlorophyll synthesis pathway protein BchC n=1 Tax=Rhabdonatronobacter sediminivivens TaxID=2743469 RepID=A0A7Z0I0J0_9RHOB|nr:chlorophyll synthesis pathway protein BchC [Rhabdonatronobacter sediminivivens]NYS25615.1 chlorophyll synthesis pathway protein BchC [Rhabdonatronobacter sediminivivens]
MQTAAILLKAPRALSLAQVGLVDPGPQDLVVRILHSGISTGTEKLFWTGEMPPFPGMGYPLVPGYEAVGEVVEAGPQTGFRVGERVFVPGANCFAALEEGPVYGLFGGAAQTLVTRADRVTRVDAGMGAEGALLALAATARHALAAENSALPDLIVGHGVLGRLLARITVALGAPPPTVWEVNPARRAGAKGYAVLDPDTDTRGDYRAIYDASGAEGLLDSLIGRIAKGGEVVLAGFYTQPIQFAFVPAFMREARLRIAAEWTPADLEATRDLIDGGALSLSGLITHHARPDQAARAYETAFGDPDCLKMILDWEA